MEKNIFNNLISDDNYHITLILLIYSEYIYIYIHIILKYNHYNLDTIYIWPIIIFFLLIR